MGNKSGSKGGIEVNAKRSRFIFLILLLFFAYTIYLISQLMGRSHVASYQVRSGSLALHNLYTGITMREESVVYSKDTGYVAYFAREGEHMGVGDMVYAIDETGSLNELSKNTSGESSLSDTELRELRSEIVDFSAGFDPGDFSKSYDFLYDIDGSLLRLANLNMMESITEVGGCYTAELVRLCRTDRSGYVVYHTDGFESISSNDIKPELFDKSAYVKKQLTNNALVGAGDPVYKLLTSENWQLVIPVESQRAFELKEEGYVKVRFLKDRQELWASVELLPCNDETIYVILGFNSCMISYCTDRFLDIELIESNESGLKIPVSSIAHKEFFLVPRDYVLEERDDSIKVLRKTFTADGSSSEEEMFFEVYSANEEYFYVSDPRMGIGDYLIKPNDMAEYPVSLKGELIGVYYINKGYADFRQISILAQNDEYAIVKPNTTYGLTEYDYIALDASSLFDDDFIFDNGVGK